MVDVLVDEHCEKHGWHYEVGDECPCCLGENQERERIIALLQQAQPVVIERDRLVELIKGEKE
jgi:hypothetical protein